MSVKLPGKHRIPENPVSTNMCVSYAGVGIAAKDAPLSYHARPCSAQHSIAQQGIDASDLYEQTHNSTSSPALLHAEKGAKSASASEMC